MNDILIKFATGMYKNLGTHKGQRNALIALVLVMFLIMRSCCGTGGSSDADITMYRQNIEALKDGVRTYANKNGELVYQKKSLLATNDRLYEYNHNLAAEVKKLKDNPIVITEYKTKIVYDTVWLTTSVDSAGIIYYDGTVTVPFVWSRDTTYAPGNSRHLGGRYVIKSDCDGPVTESFAITRDSMTMSFYTGVTENRDGLLEIFIRSDYPGFSAVDINGAVMDPRESKVISSFFPKQRWSVGPYVGYGGYVSPQGVIGHGFGVGVSLQYGVIQWGGKK